jgi:hypothetical protein
MFARGVYLVSTPSKNPVNESSFAGMFNEVLGKFSQRLECMLPAEIVTYDRATNTATVRPLIALLTTDGLAVSRPRIARVPVLAMGGGGFVLNFPLVPGDKGWIEASDRDISLFMQAEQVESQPNTFRLHSFEDARFIPDIFGKYTLAPTAEGALTIQSLDGSVSVTLSPDTITLTAPNVIVNASTKADIKAPAITVEGSSTLALKAPNITIDGAVNQGSGGFVIGGIPFGSHKHGGVDPGGGTSGGPTA